MATEMVLIPKSTYDKWLTSRGKHNQQEELDVMDVGSLTNDVDTKDVEMPDEMLKNTDDIIMEKKPEVSPGLNELKITPSVDNSLPANISDGQDISSSLLETFPQKYRLYAKRLLLFIKKHGVGIIEWTNDGVVLFKGGALLGSDITEVITHLFKTNRAPPTGMKQFREGLDKIRVPKAFIKPYLLKPPGIPANIKKNWVKY